MAPGNTRVRTSNIRIHTDKEHTVTYRLQTNTLVTYECVGAQYDGGRGNGVINLKCTSFLFTFHFYTCTGHVFHTHASERKCHTHLYPYVILCTRMLFICTCVLFVFSCMSLVCTCMYRYVTRMFPGVF